jgi:hypothetical protein
MQIRKQFIGITVTALLLSTVTIFANENSKDEKKTAKLVESVKKAGEKDQAESGIAANDLVRKAYRTIGDLDKYSFEATIVNDDDLGKEGMMVDIVHHYKVSLMAPDKIRMDVRGDSENKNIYFNKGTVTVVNDDNKSYGQITVSPEINNALDDIRDEYGFSIPLTQFLYSDMDQEINASVKGYYLGTVLEGDTPCYHLAFPGEKWDVQYWIEKGKMPLIRKVAFVDKMTKGEPRSIVSVKWDIDAPIDEKIFQAEIPEGAEKAEVLTVKEAEKLKKRIEAKAEDKK